MQAGRPIVETKVGPIVGRRSEGVDVFKGIPFATPPVGAMRFRPPEPAPAWRAPFDASAFGPAPIQAKMPMIKLADEMSEDCLTLNIWAPVTKGPHPVVFSIFGGGNILGAASQPDYDGGTYARRNVVYVSANYRLGAFGFMELGALDPALAGSGLNGLLDIIAALRWVRDNIGSFGGDPQRVSLIGISAGGKNQCALAAMPSARGLFQQMAIFSGGGHTIFSTADQAAPVARSVMRNAALAPNDIQGLISAPAAALLEAQTKTIAEFPRAFPFRPTLDGKLLPMLPLEAARTGRTAGLNIIMGTNRDEAGLIMAMGPPNGAIAAKQVANIEFAAMEVMRARYEMAFPRLSASARNIRQLTAEEYWLPSVRYAEAHAKSGGRVWMHRFDWSPDSGPFDGLAVHGANAPFVYGGDGFMGTPMGAGARDAARRALVMWAQWVRGGAPQLQGGPEWPLYDEKRRTLILKGVPEIVIDPDADERRLWDNML